MKIYPLGQGRDRNFWVFLRSLFLITLGTNKNLSVRNFCETIFIVPSWHGDSQSLESNMKAVLESVKL